MKRWRPPSRLIVLVLLLLTGSLVNVAVAWGIAALGPVPQFGLKLLGVRASGGGKVEHVGAIVVSAGPSTGNQRPAGWRLPMHPRCGVCSTVRAGLGYWQCWEFDFEDRQVCVTVAVGLPRPSMRAALREPAPNLFVAPAPVGTGLFSRTGGAPPLNPYLPGFLLNTLFYAALLALPLSFFPFRRRLRARRGRCPKCGYDLVGLADPAAPCPECGAAR